MMDRDGGIADKLLNVAGVMYYAVSRETPETDAGPTETIAFVKAKNFGPIVLTHSSLRS